jgi:hypothetical protein
LEIPEKYRDKIFLDTKDIKDMLNVGDNSTYEFLRNAPFRTVRVGSMIKVPANSFWKWYFSEE